MDRVESDRIRPQITGFDSSSVAEGPTVDQQRQEEQPESGIEEVHAPGGSDADDRAPYAVRLRVILLLSLACWAILALAVVWLIRHV